MERSIAELPSVFVNAGRKGLLAEMAPPELVRLLDPIPVDASSPLRD
ncbi:MAG: hypothetical protein WCY54_03650 [Syntrophales bacterium]